MLTLDSATAGYGDTMVLRSVDLTVGDGEVVALLGPNGAGKSTLLRTATGFVKPRSGRVRARRGGPHRPLSVRVCPPGGVSPARRAGIFPSLTVQENLTIQSRGRPIGDATAEATELFPVLGSRAEQTAGSLSGGEQQMLALSRAYITKPKVVLVDEASLGLAPIMVDKIYEALAELVTRGMSVIVVEQYVQKALSLAKTVYILSRGEIIHHGPADQIDTDEIYQRYLGIES